VSGLKMQYASVSKGFANVVITLKRHFPGMDFRAYFAYIKKYRKSKAKGLQKHHILPRCEFPELSNITWNWAWLTYDEHKKAHKLLAAAVPNHGGFRKAAIHLFDKTAKVFSDFARRGGQRNVESGKLAKARAVQAAAGWPNLIKARKIQGSQGLRLAGLKGNAVSAAKNWVNQKKARSKDLAERLTRLEKGHTTQARQGYPALRAANHLRWHSRRGKLIISCEHCRTKRKK
jgi:hypothetical protein